MRMTKNVEALKLNLDASLRSEVIHAFKTKSDDVLIRVSPLMVTQVRAVGESFPADPAHVGPVA